MGEGARRTTLDPPREQFDPPQHPQHPLGWRALQVVGPLEQARPQLVSIHCTPHVVQPHGLPNLRFQPRTVPGDRKPGERRFPCGKGTLLIPGRKILMTRPD